MTLDQAGTDDPVHYDVTRIRLIDALADHPLGAYLHLEARGRMADALLVKMPVVTNAAFYMEGVKAERERIAADILMQKVPCPEHPPPLQEPSCWTCGRNGAFQRASAVALATWEPPPGSVAWEPAL